MAANEIISVLGLLGIGAILKSIIDYFFNNRKRRSEARDQFKETRYKAVIILCHALTTYETQGQKLSKSRSDITTPKELFNEIYTEWINMSLYASYQVIEMMRVFLENQDLKSFQAVILSMRKDLFGIRTSLTGKELTLNSLKPEMGDEKQS